MLIEMCPKCENIKIKKHKNGRRICLKCNKHFSENTSLKREVKDTDYIILSKKSSDEDKKKIYDFLFGSLKNKNKFLNNKNTDESLKYWLDINYIKIDDLDVNVENVYFFLSGMNEEDRTCKICGKKTKFIGIRNRKIYNDFCSDDCLYKYRSQNQIGDLNNVYKMDYDTKEKWKKKISDIMKNNIKNNKFTPNITNSWCRSKIKTIINNKTINHRSSWEAFFHLVNNELLYEKKRIEYYYENNRHNYIVDFIDEKNKILYEVKPNSEKTKLKNKCKRNAAIEWCKNNNYTYKVISDDWFKNNYIKYKHLIKNQPNEHELLRKLKQFDEN